MAAFSNTNSYSHSIETLYAEYCRFLEQFHAAKGPRRPLMTLDQFDRWWSRLSDSEQQSYAGYFAAGYQDPASQPETLALIGQYLSSGTNAKSQ